MAVPLENLLFSPGASRRDIENHYHLALAAENSQQIVRYQAASFRLQATEAARLSERQDYTDSLLADMGSEMAWMSQGIDRLNETALEQLTRLDNLNTTVRNGLQALSEQLLNNQRTLDSILETLSRPYETQALELRKKADEWLKHGQKNSGQDQKEDYDDSMRLLLQTVDNPIGKQDYVAWFQIGWLLWKHENKAPDSEEAFRKAVRLSAPDKNLYHVMSLLHYAYMQYLRNSFQEAYDTAKRALEVEESHDTMFEVARYAAKTERRQEVLSLLEKCVQLRPTTFETMLAEPDFAEMREEIEALRSKLLETARTRAQTAIKKCEKASNSVLEMLQEIGDASQIPRELDATVLHHREPVSNLPYLTVLDLERIAYDLRESTIAWAKSYLKHLREYTNASITRIQDDIEKAEKTSAADVKALKEQCKPMLTRELLGTVKELVSAAKSDLLEMPIFLIFLVLYVIYLTVALPWLLYEGARRRRELAKCQRKVAEYEDRLHQRLSELNTELLSSTERCKKIDSLLERLGT